MMITKCKICHANLENIFNAREMMFGIGKEFPYAQCSNCQTIQILEIPKDIASYYPEYYYSFRQYIPPITGIKAILKRIFKKYRIRKFRHEILDQLQPLNILHTQRILDIGCGRGKLICEMFNYGYKNIQGVDRFIPQEYQHGHNVKVLKNDLSELKNNSYDLLMMHHVFEHMEEPMNELAKAYKLLKNNGYLMIRIPVVNDAWSIYHRDWVQLDAPRHFFIHTEKSISIMAKEVGFTVTDVVYDSNSMQFWGSELYKRDIPLINESSKDFINPDDFFSPTEIAGYEQYAKELNHNNKGDQAIFYLQKKVN
ncbi:class I SAM-dependent methyltransferase [Elizabethkingia meningoseptica]|uniref:class I SAM-dependent methyltransferase n=1 Tax=Elizabethkingia meningoseptica TaxID=238 RepID=UPI000999FE19|nr:class I SAM-dependent methyltransferase [Elizabethkingia meningoseptica]